jgi:nicotinate phosphoribosyltransferase
MTGDIIGLRDENNPQAKPLLEQVMDQGRLLRPHPQLKTCREYFLSELKRLPMNYRSLSHPPVYPVRISCELAIIQSQVENQIRRQELL